MRLAAVVGVQVELLDLAHAREARVSAGALVIECIFRQFIHVRQEVCFLNASFTDRFRNTQFSFQRFQPCQQFLDLSSSTVARCAQTQVVGNFSITTACLRTVVLTECSLLSRVIVRIVANDEVPGTPDRAEYGTGNPVCAPLSDIHPGRRSQTRYPR